MNEQHIGQIRLFTCTNAPVGWLLCDNAVYKISDYPLLFSIIRNTYGGSHQSGTFRVPDLREHVPSFGDAQAASYAYREQGHSIASPSLALKFCISYEGAYRPD